MDEPIAAIVTTNVSQEGSLLLRVTPADAGEMFFVSPSTLMLSIWREEPGVFRLSLRNPRSNLAAHAQAGSTIVAFVIDLGLRLGRPRA